jgi:hypothetical protein
VNHLILLIVHNVQIKEHVIVNMFLNVQLMEDNKDDVFGKKNILKFEFYFKYLYLK